MPALKHPSNILVVRNDKLGDFMLAWPALSLIKQACPDSKITVLVPEYTRQMAEICPWVDDIIIDDQRLSAISDARHLCEKIKSCHFDASITLFSEFRVALALWLAGIPHRFAPSTKLWLALYNHRLTQKRSQSRKPEYVYNTDLVRLFTRTFGLPDQNLKDPPFLEFDTSEIERIRIDFFQKHNIGNLKKLVFVHTGSGGSANNLTQQQYADLIRYLSIDPDLYFVLTAGPSELEHTTVLSNLIEDIDHCVFHSTKGLINFAKHIALCDLFISGSTGPLHVAGALNRRTVAFYPIRRSATSLRWQTMNEDKKRLSFSPDPSAAKNDLSTINIKQCAENILNNLVI